MVGALGPQPLGGHGGLAEPLPLAFPLPHRSNPLGVQLCRTLNFNTALTAAASWPLACFRTTGVKRTQQIEQQSRCCPGPFAGP